MYIYITDLVSIGFPYKLIFYILHYLDLYLVLKYNELISLRLHLRLNFTLSLFHGICDMTYLMRHGSYDTTVFTESVK